jgi:hypothetical protein
LWWCFVIVAIFCCIFLNVKDKHGLEGNRGNNLPAPRREHMKHGREAESHDTIYKAREDPGEL